MDVGYKGRDSLLYREPVCIERFGRQKNIKIEMENGYD